MAYNTYGAPYLSSYADAVKRYEDTKPIRGQTVRPLGNRRYHMYASIEKRDSDIVLTYERFPCVVWSPDNTFTVTAPRYYNAFQADKMMGMLPHGCGFEWDGGRLFVATGLGKHHLPRNRSLEFKQDGVQIGGRPRYVCVDAAVPLEYKMRRGMQGKLVDRHFAPFLSWVRVVLDESVRKTYEEINPSFNKFCTDLGYSKEQMDAQQRAVESLDPSSEYRASVYRFLNQLSKLPFPATGERWFSRPACELLFDRISGEDATHWPDMLNVICKNAGSYFWGRGLGGYATKYDDVVEYLKQLVSFLYRDHVFEVERLEPGQIPSKRNAHFKNEIVHVF